MTAESQSDTKPNFRTRYKEARTETEHSTGSQRALLALAWLVCIVCLANVYSQYASGANFPYVMEVRRFLEGVATFASDPLGSVVLAGVAIWHLLSRLFGIRDHLRESREE
ncbi:MAG: hypothetical protein WAX38_04150 [Minisyncoccia bacterium]